jgi:predicted ATPase/DNA-binding XRE family transcriptional regulator
MGAGVKRRTSVRGRSRRRYRAILASEVGALVTAERPAFGALLRRLRLRAQLSQEALAERAKISVQAVSALERGARRAPQRQTIGLLADALGLEGTALEEFARAAAASARARVRGAAAAEEADESSELALLNAPSPPSNFVGRERERAELGASLRAGSCVTIWGSGGIGKTRLLYETLAVIGDRFPDGATIVELATLTDDAEVERAVAAALAIVEEADRPLADTIAAALSGRNALLAFDNAEHLLLATARLIERLARSAPSLAFAATSREPLRIACERVVALDPLPIPDPDDRALAHAPAVQLFYERAASGGARLRSTPEELREVATICAKLDAIPLALELAASRASLMTPAQIANALDDRLRLLVRGTRTANARHATLLGTLEWSYALISDVERAVLRRVALWPGSWTLDDAVALAATDEIDRWAVIEAVGGLVDRSLVVADEVDDARERRFRLLQTMTIFALDRLAESGETETCRRLLAERVRDVAERACAQWRRGDERELRAIGLGAVRAALRWALELGNDPVLGARIAADVAVMWEMRDMPREGVRYLDSAIAALPADATEVAMRAFGARSQLRRYLHSYQQAYEDAERAMRLADAAGDLSFGATARIEMADPASALGRDDEARRLLDEALLLCERVGDTYKSAAILWERAFVDSRASRLTQARDGFALVIPMLRERGDVRAATQGAINLAEIEFMLGNRAGAIDAGLRALEAARSLGAARLIGFAAGNLAAYQLDAGDADAAVTFAREAMQIGIEHGHDVAVGNAVIHIADALARAGHLREGALLLGYAARKLHGTGAAREETERRGYDSAMQRLAHAYDAGELAALLQRGEHLDDSAAVRLAAV